MDGGTDVGRAVRSDQYKMDGGTDVGLAVRRDPYKMDGGTDVGRAVRSDQYKMDGGTDVGRAVRSDQYKMDGGTDVGLAVRSDQYKMDGGTDVGRAVKSDQYKMDGGTDVGRAVRSDQYKMDGGTDVGRAVRSDQYKMECGTDVGLAVRSVSPDLDILRRNIMIDFHIGQEFQTTEVPERRVSDNRPDSDPQTCPLGLRGQPEVPRCDIDDTLTVVKDNLTESEEDIHIKKESKNIVLNELPFYRNRIILGKINVDDEECENDAPGDYNVVDVPEPDKHVRISNQYSEMERCLLAIVVVTDCYEALLDNECYCARCAVLFPSRELYTGHYRSTHTETTNTTVDELDNVVTSDSNNIQDKGHAHKEPDLDMPHNLEESGTKQLLYQHDVDTAISINSDKDRSRRITKQYNDMERCLQVKVVLRDCYRSLLDNECYCARCAVLFPNCTARSEHDTSTHAETHTHTETTHATEATPAVVTKTRSLRASVRENRLSRTHSHSHCETCARSATDTEFKCETCKKGFSSLGLLKRHGRVVHTSEKPSRCVIRKKRVRVHTETTHATKASAAAETFLQQQEQQLISSKIQMKTHNGIKLYECKTCKILFSQKARLIQHQFIHIGDKKNNDNHVNRHILKIHKGMNIFECKRCKKSFRHKAQLKKHEYIHNTLDTNTKSHLTSFTECKTSNMRFRQKDHLNQQSHTPEKPYEWKTCKKTDRFIDNQSRHRLIPIILKDENPFECKTCRKRFKQKAQLNQHKFIHTNVHSADENLTTTKAIEQIYSVNS